MSVGRPRRASDNQASPALLSGLSGGRRGGRRAGWVLGASVAVALSLAPGVATGAIYRVMKGDGETLPRRSLDAFDRIRTFGPAHAFDGTQEARHAAELFQRQCVACHGKRGKGDGPAAAAMTPRPANLTDPERMGELSDEELIEVLTKGKGAMPSFGALLGPEEIRAMARYVRELSGTEDEH